MSAELVHANVNDLDRLDPQSREVAVTSMLSEARQWLAHAVEATEPKRISEFKAFMATVAETTKQLNLSKDIQLDALEMVRRAERGVGKAIRQGQKEGTVARRGQTKTAGLDGVDNAIMLPTELASRPELNAGGGNPGIYDLTDEVSDDEFEAALDAAKGEKNVSRANVVRKIRNGAVKDETWDEIRELAEQGWSSAQLANRQHILTLTPIGSESVTATLTRDEAGHTLRVGRWSGTVDQLAAEVERRSAGWSAPPEVRHQWRGEYSALEAMCRARIAGWAS